MADPPRHSTPRWVKVFGITATVIVLILLVLILLLIGDGRHGPSRHTHRPVTPLTTQRPIEHRAME